MFLYCYNCLYQFIYGYGLFVHVYCRVWPVALAMRLLLFINRTRQLAMRVGSAMASVGQLTEFNHEMESIDAYIERVELYLLANEIEEERHAAVLLSVIGASNYLLLRDLISPVSPKDKFFADLIAVLKVILPPSL